MKRISFLLGCALSLGGALLLSAGPVHGQGASTCNAEIIHVQEQWRGTPITASRSNIKPSITAINSADQAARPLATSSPTRMGATIGESLGQGPGAGPVEFSKSAHAVPNGSGEANLASALPGPQGYNVANTVPSGTVMGGGSNPDEVAAALARAQAYSQAGNYSACMTAVREAQRYLR